MPKDGAIVVSRHSRSDLDIVGNKLRRCFRSTDDGSDFGDLLARLAGVGGEGGPDHVDRQLP